MIMIDFLQLFKGMLFNFLIYFFLASLYAQIQLNEKMVSHFSKSLLTGMIFGGIACLGMAVGVDLQVGMKVDGRIRIVGIATSYGGVGAGIITALIVTTFRAFLGGLGVYVGVAGIFGGFLVGAIFNRKNFSKAQYFNWKNLILLGIVLTLQAQLFIFLFFPFDVAV